MPKVAKSKEKKAKAKSSVVKKTVKISKAIKAEGAVKPVKPTRQRAKSAEDTGSVDFQIKNFSEKINSLAKHLKTHIHDFDSRRGLLIMVGKRRRLLNYVKKNDQAKYEKLIGELKLKKTIDKEEKKK